MRSLPARLGAMFTPARAHPDAALAARRARALAARLGVTIDTADSRPGALAIWLVGGPEAAFPERFATSWPEALEALKAAQILMED